MQGTDNSLLSFKVWLRVDHLPPDRIRVLDCFGGHGIVWQCVKKISGRTDIERNAIDQERRKGCVHGNNIKWLASIDIHAYNIIDLDAYGVPYSQIRLLKDRGYHGRVFFTMIQSVMGKLPQKMLSECGITKQMYRNCPTLYGQRGWSFWLEWLGQLGVTKVYHRSMNRKHYGCFDFAT